MRILRPARVILLIVGVALQAVAAAEPARPRTATIEAGVAVQDVSYDRLRERLLADGQVLEWTGPSRRPKPEPVGSPAP